MNEASYIIRVCYLHSVNHVHDLITLVHVLQRVHLVTEDTYVESLDIVNAELHFYSALVEFTFIITHIWYESLHPPHSCHCERPKTHAHHTLKSTQ